MTRRPTGLMLARIVSGGQTGVDRAALDAAMRLGIACGGWVPRGRRAEDGVIPRRYPMHETETAAYAQRTRRNVRDSDATLILSRGRPSGGTALTVSCAVALGRLHQIVDLQGAPAPLAMREWLIDKAVVVLNIAGPRESSAPGIYAEALAYLEAVLTDSQARR